MNMDLGNLMRKEYIRIVEGVYRIGDTRVSLDSLVYLFREGMSAESMVESYPVLTLEQVHGAATAVGLFTVLPVRFTPLSILGAFPVTVLLGVAATLLPAWQSANASPALLRKE